AKSAACSHMMRSCGPRRSSTLCTEMRQLVARKPNEAARGEAPSITRIVPCSTRELHSVSFDAAPAGITSTSPRSAALCKPMEERIAAHPPESSPATWKVRVAAVHGTARRNASVLASECIPHSDAHIVEVGTVRISRVDQVRSAQKIHRKLHRIHPPAHAGAALDRVGPVVAFGIDGGVPVPVDLDAFAESPAG